MPRGRTKEFDRSKALDKAMLLFWKQGYASTGLSELLKHMRISRQSLYDTYGDKRSLFLESLERYMETWIGRQIACLEASGSPLERVREVLTMYQLHATSGNGLGCLLANSLAEFGGRDPLVNTQLKAKVMQLESAFRACLRRAQLIGELSKKANVPALSRTLVMTAHGISVLGRLGVSNDLIEDSVRMISSLLASNGARG